MLIDLSIAAAVLLFGNLVFYHFDPMLPLWKRIGKVVLALAILGVVSHYFGHAGVLIAAGIFLVPLVYIHGIWLPRHGVNGWTGEPREKYYELRGWPPTGPHR
jgi:hypothetical protein